jgi:catechol 2,3-dioxygenase-like lactoylglutathione lyase family enzyme
MEAILRSEGSRMKPEALEQRVRVAGVDHVSVTTRDLDASIAFYEGLLGLSVAARGESQDEEIAEMMGLDRVRIQWADVDAGDGMVLELVQFLHPVGTPIARSLWDPGASHIGLLVDDIDAMRARLVEADVRVISKPVRLTEEGSWHGAKVLYAVDPDGAWIELVERPEPVTVLSHEGDEAVRIDVSRDGEETVGDTTR